MPLEIGSTLKDRYHILGLLGKGGMGAVYVAHDLTLDIRVAVKENLNLSPESEKQFHREARILAGLRHPNLPRVTDHFILEGRQYLVMDFIEGTNLHTRAERHPPTVDEVLTWADAVCSALTYLHTRPQSVIHRDVKPANIKLQPDGNVVLVDFGLAKEYDQAVTSTGARGLTPGFSPPEQYSDQRTDARSDQYSLAATIYALLTNQRPVDSIKRILKKSVLKPVREINPAVPRHVDEALQRAMALDKDDRFPDVKTFHAALRGELSLETIRSAEVPVSTPPRSRLPLLLGAGALGLILVGGAAFLFFGGTPSLPPSAGASVTPSSAAVAVAGPTRTSPPTSAPTLPASPPSATPEPSDTPPPSATPSPTPVPLGGGGRIAFVSDRTEAILQIWTMNPDGSDPQQVTFGPGDKSQPEWSPDGSHLLYTAPGGVDAYGNNLGLDLWLYPLDRSMEPVNLTHHPGDDTDPAWSPDGSKIAFTSTRANDLRQVFMLDASCTDQPQTCREQQPQNVSCSADFCAVEFSPAWAPPGWSPPSWLSADEQLAVAVSINDAPAQIFFRPPETPEPLETPTPVVPTDFDRNDRVVGVDHLTWSPDGSLILFTWYYKRGVNEIFVAPLSGRGAESNRLTKSNGNKEPAFSPDGKWIVFTSTRDQNPEIYLMTSNGAGEKNLTQNPARDMQPAWQPRPLEAP